MNCSSWKIQHVSWLKGNASIVVIIGTVSADVQVAMFAYLLTITKW